jgi:ABC-type nitrate/sulfonate/bicarbonate transport system substrate-binding protein
VLVEPLIPDALATAKLFSPCFEGVAPRYALTGFFAASGWAKTHASAITKFQDVMRQTAMWAKNNKAASAAILAKATNVSVDVIRRSARSEYGTDLDPALFQPVIDVTAKYSGLFAPFPAAELLYATAPR